MRTNSGMKKMSKRLRYDLHSNKHSVAYGTRTVRIRDGADWNEALKQIPKSKPTYQQKPAYIRHKQEIRVKGDTKNIITNREEYLVIKSAYQNQINSYDTEDKEQIHLADELENEMNLFIKENIKYERGDF